MFEGAGAESICGADRSLEPGYAIANGVGANLAPANPVRSQTVRTITARDVPFPLADAFSPVTRTRVPVPGLNHWPGRYNRLGRKYYGLSAGVDAKDSAKLQKAFGKRKGFAGLGAFEPGWDAGLGLPPVMPPLATTPPISGGSSSGFSWSQLFGTIAQTLPATISAVKGTGVPYGYYNSQGQTQQAQTYRTPPEGYYYDSSGQLVRNAVSNVTSFITENPLLVGGAILGAVLLFMRPPARR